MRRLLSSILGAAAAAGLAAAGLVAAAAPAAAAACSGTSGVTVVVDTGSSVVTACAPGDPSSGLQALNLAGFGVTQVATQPGFVCRINGFPSSDPCHSTPPATAYWAYYHAARGGSWSYSSTGAGSYDPQPGTVQGWRFGSGQQPRIAPPAPTATVSTPKTTSTPRTTTAAPKPAATPRKTTTAPRATTGSTTAGTTPATPGARPSTAPSRSATATPSPSASPTGSASASPSPTDDATPTDGPTAVASAPTSGDAGPGGTPLLAGGALIALVAGGAGWTVWRRRG